MDAGSGLPFEEDPMRHAPFPALLAAVLVTLIVLAADADTLRNRKTGEKLEGTVLATAERDGEPLLFVRLATGERKFLPARDWEVKSEAEELVKKLRSKDPKECQAAVDALVQIGRPALKHLESLAQDKDTELAQLAAQVIAQIRKSTKRTTGPSVPPKGKPAAKRPAVARKKTPPPKTVVVMRNCRRCAGKGRVRCTSCGGRRRSGGGTCFKCNNLGVMPCRTCGGRGKLKVKVKAPVKK
jgi:hypothetical protein